MAAAAASAAMIDISTFESVKQAHVISYSLVDKERRCAICKAMYREMENMGSWKCWQHTGDLVNNMWTCCRLVVTQFGRGEDAFYQSTFPPVNQQGCVRCDHKPSIRPYTRNDSVLLTSQQLKPFSGMAKRAVLVMRAPQMPPAIIVWRHDQQQQDILEKIISNHQAAEAGNLPGDYLVSGSLCQKPDKQRQMAELIF